MKSIIVTALVATLGLAVCACEVTTPTGAPGPAGPPGATGNAGVTGATGDQGAAGKPAGSTVVVVPNPDSDRR
jgi:hypothetical protein